MESPKKPLVFAYYVTGHGFGHATRVVEVVRNLIQAGHDVHVVTAAPDYVFTTEIQSPRLFIRKVLLDCGAVQADALTVDRLASLEKYVQTAVVPRASILATEIEWLKSIEADLVVSDVVPVACRAAADAGIRSVCVSNFSWDFIYAEYVMVTGYRSRSIVLQIAEDYSHSEFLIRLPGYCPMPAFRDTVDVPLVVRRLHKNRAEVRKELGIGEDVKVLIYNFGGQPAGWKIKKEYLPDGWICLVCGASEGQELPENFMKLPKGVYTPDVIAASDCMIGKIGYGTASEALAYKVPFIFIRRDYFNEEPFVRNMLEHFQCGVEMIRRDLLTGHWTPYIERAFTLNPCYEAGTNGGEVAAKILQDTAFGKDHAPSKLSGPRRLRDAIVLGYQLQRVPGKDIAVPEWYTNAQNELNIRTSSPDNNVIQSSSFTNKNEDFEILHGDHHGLSDTIAFLKKLTELHDLNNPGNRSKQHSREQLAAAALFNWEDEVFVARAPGRLDVMGGIADYSGSLVLQMPIREACHVAIQRNHPSKHKLWKHTQARQHTKQQGPIPVLQIVSFGSELSNRAPTFDMDLSDFMDGERPITYEKAYQYFAANPSQKWAAYIAGTILVLMTELGVRFEDSISILVISGVPEGKGVSSSAAIEVATMSAVAASHGLDIAPRDLALLCQKVENHIVGAPCGVMDQMASACGESNKLLAMVCQPAEVLGLVDIPPHIRFWGIDSGIQHSVGGADYGSVRIGAFMGRKIIKSMASEHLKSSLSNNNTSQPVNGVNSCEMEGNGMDLLENEASLDYLCNLSPHRYEASYLTRLPEILQGNDFVENYVHHDDSVTIINKRHKYAVRAPTRHPIYENFRVKAFKALLSAASSDDQLSALGELMYQCHYSYSACGLGSHGTDKLVELVQEIQHGKLSKFENGTLYGAKITGGGSGGTVCIIGRNRLRSSEQILKKGVTSPAKVSTSAVSTSSPPAAAASPKSADERVVLEETPLVPTALPAPVQELSPPQRADPPNVESEETLTHLPTVTESSRPDKGKSTEAVETIGGTSGCSDIADKGVDGLLRSIREWCASLEQIKTTRPTSASHSAFSEENMKALKQAVLEYVSFMDMNVGRANAAKQKDKFEQLHANLAQALVLPSLNISADLKAKLEFVHSEVPLLLAKNAELKARRAQHLRASSEKELLLLEVIKAENKLNEISSDIMVEDSLMTKLAAEMKELQAKMNDCSARMAAKSRKAAQEFERAKALAEQYKSLEVDGDVVAKLDLLSSKQGENWGQMRDLMRSVWEEL